MKGLKELSPLFTAIIAFCAFFSLQFGVVYFLLDAKIEPIKAGQAEIKQLIKDHTHKSPKQANR